MITVSIVSHRHGPFLRPLPTRLLACPEVCATVVTRNIPATLNLPADGRNHITDNAAPAGLGANHNAAFHRVTHPCSASSIQASICPATRFPPCSTVSARAMPPLPPRSS
jgi:hypothetical protein